MNKYTHSKLNYPQATCHHGNPMRKPPFTPPIRKEENKERRFSSSSFSPFPRERQTSAIHDSSQVMFVTPSLSPHTPYLWRDGWKAGLQCPIQGCWVGLQGVKEDDGSSSRMRGEQSRNLTKCKPAVSVNKCAREREKRRGLIKGGVRKKEW